MPEIIEVPITDLLLDSENARLLDPGTNQQSTALSLAKDQGEKLIRIARDITQNGIDPLSMMAVVATGDTQKRYRVLEGNRRLLALKSLETPSLVSAALGPSLTKQLEQLSADYLSTPIETLLCVLFVDETEARHWIELRHTGQNSGIGLVEWDADAKDRYEARHSGVRSPAGQLIDFVERFDLLSLEAKQSNQKVTTNLQRLLTSPVFRDKIGISIKNGRVCSNYPWDELRKPLSHVFDDLKTGRVTVPDLYNAKDRTNYAESLPTNALPNERKRLVEPVPVDELEPKTKAAKKASPAKKAVKAKASMPVGRTAVIPRTALLNVTDPRINTIFSELLNLSADQFANASAVLLRVFVELSVDHYVVARQLMTEQERRNAPLAKRLKAASADMLQQKLIDSQLDQAMQKAADSPFMFAASTANFNQYVHNKYVFPKPSEIRLAWDELQPFIGKIWR